MTLLKEEEAAARELLSGGVVVLPTETVYGLAGSALNEAAVRKIFAVKERPFFDPLIIHVANFGWLERYTQLTSLSLNVKALVEAFWPGPLTLVMPKKEIIPNIVTADKPTVAVRCPRHPIFQAVLERVQEPLAAPSANPFGYVSPTCAEQVRQTLGKRVPIILDGGPCQVGVESTILDISGKCPRILRPGAITADMVADVIHQPVEDYVPTTAVKNPTVPGQLKQHYCTHTPLKLFPHGKVPVCPVGQKVAVVFNAPVAKEDFPADGRDIFALSEHGDRQEMARNLFAVLQRLDQKGYDIIFCEYPERIDVGIAICDRLERSAAKFL